MTSTYTIAHCTNDVHKIADQFEIACTLHPEPIRGWYTTNSLTQAKKHRINLARMVKSHDVIHDMNTDEKGNERGKLHARMFCPVAWIDGASGSRSMEQVNTVQAMVFDFDGLSSVATQDVLTRFSPLCYVAYSTYSHQSPAKQGKDAFRVIAPLSRPVSPDEFKKIWMVLHNVFPENDIQTKDCSRFWYVPSVRVDREEYKWCNTNDGHQLDVEKLLHLHASTPTSQPVAHHIAPDASDIPAQKERYTKMKVPSSIQLKGSDGSFHTLAWYIEQWDSLPKHRGNYQCYAIGSDTIGSAFISKTTDVFGLSRYRVTECNKRKTNMDCIHTDLDIELRYNDKHTAWSVLPTVDNLMKLIDKEEMDIWLCEIRQRVYYKDKPLTDSLEIEIMNRLRMKYFTGKALSLKFVEQAIILHAERNKRNTLKEWLEGLEWKGESRLETLFIDWLGAEDTPLNRVYAKKWAISTIARCLKPGCKVDTMVVLKAPQGHGKGTFFRTLAGACPITGYSWYNSSKINIGEKDGRSILRTAWIHEMAELAVMAKKDANVIKNFLDEQFDTFRKVYTKHEVKEPRSCVFVGSTNDDDVGIFKDKTGSRRYWFISIEGEKHKMAYEVKKLEEAVDQIWAEAVHRFNECEEWWLTSEEQGMSSKENERHSVVGIHEQLVAGYLIDRAGKYFTVSEMVEDIYKLSTIKPMVYENYYPTLLARLGAELQNEGRRCRRSTKLKKGWYLAPQLNNDDDTSREKEELQVLDGRWEG